jgi:5-methylcytosine-specific restriction enzyme A
MPKKHDRLYDSTWWRNARKRFLLAHPLCSMCEKLGRVTPANVVDHIKPHKGSLVLFRDEKNWQALCQNCHDSAKQMQEIHGYSQACGVDGFPVDEGHPWGENGAK